MRLHPLFFASFAALGMSLDASAAVTCVANKQTGKYERPSIDAAKPATECDPATAAATLRDVQRAINDAGSKLVSASVLVNSDTIATPEPKPAQPTSEIKESPEELLKPSVPVKPDANTKRTWTLKKEKHRTLEDAIEDFAREVDYEVIYEAREFDLGLKRDIPLIPNSNMQTGTFWEMLNLLGEAYRDTDGAFQIQPTTFKQIVVKPMRTQSNSFAGQEANK